MRANNLTISIPNKGCDKHCPYCVSGINGYVDANVDNMKRNVQKVLTVARAARVSSVLLTGKGEPFLNFEDVLYFTKAFSEYPVEIQTNGRWLSDHIFGCTPGFGPIKDTPERNKKSCLPDLWTAGMNTISFSIDDENEPPSFKEMVKAIHKIGMVVRVTFNITDKLILSCSEGEVDLTFDNLVTRCLMWDVDQMTLRNICIPNNAVRTSFGKAKPQIYWIKDNVDPETYKRLSGEMKMACESGGFLVRNLPYGAKVYEYRDISVSYSDYCIQDNNNGEDIRSLIFMEDGGLYTSWNSRASRLF
jgi:hypothetical protein